MANKTLVRVELKQINGRNSEWDRDKAFKIMMNEFRKRCSDAGIQAELKEKSRFESKSRKNRKQLRDTINRRKQEEVEQKLKRGEKVTCSGKILKKILAKDRLNKKKDKDFKDKSNRY